MLSFKQRMNPDPLILTAFYVVVSSTEGDMKGHYRHQYLTSRDEIGLKYQLLYLKQGAKR